MNHSIHSADRSTHLKIVVVALVAGIVVAGLSISARTNADYSQTAHVIKAGKPVVVDQLEYDARPLSRYQFQHELIENSRAAAFGRPFALMNNVTMDWRRMGIEGQLPALRSRARKTA